MDLKEQFDALKTTDFDAYETALNQLRHSLGEDLQLQTINEEDFFFVLRPYFWFLHNPGFQQVMTSCEEALAILQQYTDTLQEEDNPMLGNEYFAVVNFLGQYVQNETFDPSGWKMLFASPEIATLTSAEKYAEQLQEKAPEGAKKLESLVDIMRRIEGTKHTAYYCLRQLGIHFTPFLQTLIHKLSTGDQGYILHAMDAFPEDPRAIEFLQTFLDTTPHEALKEQAQKSLEAVK